jgi:hypothetical protein
VDSNTDAHGPGIYALGTLYQDMMPTVTFSLTEPKAWVVTIAVFAGMAGLFVASTMFLLKGAALVPLKDPRLPESVSFENI